MRDLRKENVGEVIGQAIEMLRTAGYTLVDAPTCLGVTRQALYEGFKQDAQLQFPALPQTDWQTTKQKCDAIQT